MLVLAIFHEESFTENIPYELSVDIGNNHQYILN